MPLRKPREPTMHELRDRVSDRGFRNMGIDDVSDDWIAKEGVISYLWDRWKQSLEGVSWNDFQSVGSRATGLVEGWVDGRTEWEAVLRRYADVLDERLTD